jgi:hypothetical protein
MLFDLKGKRRRAVQITYLGLALLMGGGLVLSGIGSSASGGLLDALVGGGGSSSSDAKKPFETQIKQAETTLRTNPKDAAALATLVRAHFGLAGLEQQESNGVPVGYTDKGKAELQQADAAWSRYLGTEPAQIDPGLAATALQLYDPIALGPPTTDKAKFVRPAAALAEQQNTPQAYIKLVEVATIAGDTRTAALAERKALSFATSKDERNTLKEQIATAKASASSAAPSTGANGAAPATTTGP